MNKINGQKLLPSSDKLSVSKKKLSSSQLVPYKNIKESKVTTSKDKPKEKKETLLGNVINIKKTVIKIERLISARNTSLLKEQNNIRKENENKKRTEKEKDLETKKESKSLKIPTPNIPRIGIVDYIKNFLKWVIIGRAFILFSKHIPNILSFIKKLKPLYDFFKTLSGALFNGIVTFIEWSDKAQKKLREIVGSLGGEPFQKAFDDFSGALTTFTNLALIAGMATMGGSDLGVGDALDDIAPDTKKPTRKKPKVTTSGGRTPGRPNIRNPLRQRPQITTSGSGTGRPRVTTSGGRTARTPRPRSSAPRVTGSGANQGGKLAAKSLLRSVRPLLRGMIIGGLIDFGLSVALGENPGRAAFGAIGGTLLGTIGGVLGGPFAPFTAIGGGLLGDWAGRKLYDAFFTGKKPSNTKPQKKNQGGSIKPKTGRPLSTSRKAPIRQKIKTPVKQPIKKTEPGKDLGGVGRMRMYYSDPTYVMTMDEFNRSPLGQGSYNYLMYKEDLKKPDVIARRNRRPNPFKALTKVSETLKSTPFLGRILGAPIDAALGQKPDKFAFRSFSEGISYLTNTLATNEINQSMSILRNNIRAFAEGGEVPTRDLVSMRNRSDYGEIFENILGKDVESSFNKSLDAIRKEVDKRSQPSASEPPPGGGGGADDGIPGAKLRDGSNAKIEADLLEYFTALYGKTAAIGIVANLRRESGYRTKTPDNNLYEGMAQWSRDDRWPKFEKWAKDKGLDPYSRDAQAQYVAVELKQLGTDKRIRKAQTPEEAASIFYNEFERGAYSRPVRGNSYNPDNPHENKNKEFIKDINKSNPDIGKRTSQVIVAPPSIPSTTPTQGAIGVILPKGNPQFSSGFKWRWGRQHRGHDYGVDANSPVLSAQDGKVVDIYRDFGGHGDAVVVEHSDGSKNVYGHVISLVNKGATVKKGQTIAQVKYWPDGNGYQDNTHLHFERIEGGKHIDPSTYVNSLQPPKQQARKPGQQPPTSTNANVIDASKIPLSKQYQTIENLKPGQKIVYSRVGSIQKGKNLFGQPTTKYYDPSGKEISQDQFNNSLKNSDVLRQIKSNDRQLQNMQGGGYLDMNYKKINKPGMISNYSLDDEPESSIYIQPVYIERIVPIPGKENFMNFPGNSTALNSTSAGSRNLAR